MYEPCNMNVDAMTITRTKSTVFRNGILCEGIDPEDRGFLYGDGFFTTIRVTHGKPELWERHAKRLEHSASQLDFQVDFPALYAEIKTRAAMLDSGVLKVIVSRGIGPRGYLAPAHQADYYLQLFPQALNGVMPAISSGLLRGQLGLLPAKLAGLKTLNRLEQVMLRQELASTGWHEALVCDLSGQIVEGVYSNCFFCVDGTWWTPPLTSSGIAGVMRAEMMSRMQQLGIPLKIQSLHSAEIQRIEALFFCNALTGIVPVSQLDLRPLSLDVVRQFREQLFPPAVP